MTRWTSLLWAAVLLILAALPVIAEGVDILTGG